MNNKEQQPEPLAAILAEMRAAAKSTDLFDGEEVGEPMIRGMKVEDWAERIKEAVVAERVRKPEENYGNVAKLRNALQKLTTSVQSYLDREQVLKPLALYAVNCDARDALAAPARNCDRPECATAEGAIAALRSNPCADHDFCKEQLDCAECATRWLFAPADNNTEKTKCR